MHFVNPKQFNDFDARITTDIYLSDVCGADDQTQTDEAYSSVAISILTIVDKALVTLIFKQIETKQVLPLQNGN